MSAPIELIRFAPAWGERPCLRPVEAVPVETPQGRLIGLRDPLGYVLETVALTSDAFAIVQEFDGRQTPLEIQRAIAADSRELVHLSHIHNLARTLDAHGLLEGPSFEKKRAAARDFYRAQPARPATHAGGAYPSNPDELMAWMDAQFLAPGGPGARGAPIGRDRLRGILAPHIDPHRGGPLYAHAYKALAEQSDADLFVILGTAHASPRALFTLTSHDYATPIGAAPTAKAVVAKLGEVLGSAAFDDEAVHRAEHSCEFQALWLAYLYGARSAKPRPFEIVPILCASMYHMSTTTAYTETKRLADALAVATRGRRVAFIAAADLSHVGTMYGDDRGPSARELASLETLDRETLAFAAKGDAAGFSNHVLPDVETRRICGLTPIYASLICAGATAGEVLAYAQWSSEKDASAVTYAAATIR